MKASLTMNSLITQIENTLRIAVEEYSERILRTYGNIEAETLQRIWNDISDMKISVQPQPAQPQPAQPQPAQPQPAQPQPAQPQPAQPQPAQPQPAQPQPQPISDSNGPKKCPYQYSRGQKAGTICGSNIRKKGANYCSKHKKHENQLPLPATSIGVKIPESVQQEEEIPEQKQPRIKNRRLKKNKDLDVLWHPETRFVFKSVKDKIIVGRVEDDNNIRKLWSNETLEAREWGFEVDSYAIISNDNIMNEKQEVIEEPVEEAVEETIEEPVEEAVEETIEEPLKEAELELVEEAISEVLDSRTLSREDISTILNEIQEPSPEEEEVLNEIEEEYLEEED